MIDLLRQPSQSAPPSRQAIGAPVLQVSNLKVAFDRNGRVETAVEALNFDLCAGSTLAIVGESGSGKSVSCRAAMGLLPANAIVSGSIRIMGEEFLTLRERERQLRRGRDIAMVFQNAERALNPVIPIGSQVAESVGAHSRMTRAAARRRAEELLQLLGLQTRRSLYSAYPHELSGGMRQRVMIAIAIAQQPKILIADEPTSSLDAVTQIQTIDLLLDLQKQFDMALLLVSHDLKLVAQCTDSVLVMRRGQMIEHGPSADVLERPRTDYARSLVTAANDLCAYLQDSKASEANEAPLLVAKGVSHDFVTRVTAGSKRGLVRALSNVSFELKRAETLAIVGETGSGKSTLARALLQLPAPMSGSIVFRGHILSDLKGRRLKEQWRHMQMVFQDPFSSLNPKWKVFDAIEEPMIGHRCVESSLRRARAEELLHLVGLPVSLGDRLPTELSGGQCQRVAIARALATRPSLVICDEAMSSLDAITQHHTAELIQKLRTQTGTAWLFISHDLRMVARISDRTAVMHLGQICEIGPTRAVYLEPRHPYSSALLESIAVTREPGLKRSPRTSGPEPHGPAAAPAACRFSPHCDRAEERCRTEAPPLKCIGDGHFVACYFPLNGSEVS